MQEIFVYIELNNNNEPNAVSLELLNKAQELSKEFCEKKPVAGVLILPSNIGEIPECTAKQLFFNGADKIYKIKNDFITNYSTILYSRAIIELIKSKNPSIMLIGATHIGRDLAPRISSNLKTGLVADCTGIDIVKHKEDLKLASTRPTFGGQMMATILCKTTPQMSTIRPHVFKQAENPYSENGEIIEFEPNLSDVHDFVKIIEQIKEEKTTVNLEAAQIIVAGGVGLKNKENFKKLEEFANLIGASVAGSRAACDMGLITKEHQVGQTGKTVAPRVYFAFGISGAIHHIIGMSNSKTIIAINTDPNAPIFEHSTYKITKDAVEVLDTLIEAFKNKPC